ncbi:hypothetical protein [Paraburkholderia silvatlantica]|uniref:hypothetical protein n=1 Tax=Paraburkholderia silvatlantica TaxID=321895 RepID=UPI000D756F9E
MERAPFRCVAERGRRITVFSSQPYDQRFLDEALEHHGAGLNATFVYQQASLSDQTVSLVQGSDAVCVFVNDRLDPAVLEELARQGVRAILFLDRIPQILITIRPLWHEVKLPFHSICRCPRAWNHMAMAP